MKSEKEYLKFSTHKPETSGGAEYHPPQRRTTMRPKAQFLSNPKLILISCVLLLFIFFTLRSSFSSNPQQIPQTISTTTDSVNSNSSDHLREQQTSCPPTPLTPTCTKIPSPLAEALVHYATSNVTPQQTFNEISITSRVLQRKSPCNFLVFGLGRDSLMWAGLNYGGHTVFVEEDKAWIDQIKQR